MTVHSHACAHTCFTVAPVTITSHPTNMTINGTEEATFSVEATGGGLTYQWKRNGVSLRETAGKLEGVNSPVLMVLDAQVGDEGFYSCVVTNGAGDGESSNQAFLFTVGKETIFIEILAIILVKQIGS